MLSKTITSIILSLMFCVPRMTTASAHSLDELDRLYGDEPIPPELVELTRELNMTAGAKSIREQVHEKQHQVLEQYIHARMERKCEDALTNVSRLDREIVVLQAQGQHEEEQAKRKVRDDTALFIKRSCSSASPTK
jgi:hypothetical protein